MSCNNATRLDCSWWAKRLMRARRPGRPLRIVSRFPSRLARALRHSRPPMPASSRYPRYRNITPRWKLMGTMARLKGLW